MAHFGDRWIMASPDGTLIDVPFNHLVALRDVTGKQSYQQIDQFELPVSDHDLRNWVRQGQEAAAVITSRGNLPESIYQPDSGFDWEGSDFVAARRFCACCFSSDQVIYPEPMLGTGPVKASTDSLRAAPPEGIDRSLPWTECWVVAEVSHPAFCSARDLTACAAMLGGHALDVVEGLTVRLQRVHVEMIESVRSAFISEVASSSASLHVAEDGGLGELLPANSTVSLDKSASRPSLEALKRPRTALGLSPPVVVDDGPGADEQAVGKTSYPNDARILEAWSDEHELKNRSW